MGLGLVIYEILFFVMDSVSSDVGCLGCFCNDSLCI